MSIPPKNDAVGIYLFNTYIVVRYWYPLIVIPSSLNFLAISRGDSFDIYNQNLSIDSHTSRRMRSLPSRIECISDYALAMW
jgi:hypothetical protein